MWLPVSKDMLEKLSQIGPCFVANIGSAPHRDLRWWVAKTWFPLSQMAAWATDHYRAADGFAKIRIRRHGQKSQGSMAKRKRGRFWQMPVTTLERNIGTGYLGHLKPCNWANFPWFYPVVYLWKPMEHGGLWWCFLLGTSQKLIKDCNLWRFTYGWKIMVQIYASYHIYEELIWLVVWPPFFKCSHILGMSSSQLTFIFFRGVAQPPTSYERLPC